MDETSVRDLLERHYEYTATGQAAAHEIYHDDAVLEFPQSGERFVGLRNFREWRDRYPAAVDFRVRRIRGLGDLWVTEVSISYDGGPWQFGVNIKEFRGNKVAHETIYVSEGWDAPAWRAPWRSEPAEESSVPAADRVSATAAGVPIIEQEPVV